MRMSRRDQSVIEKLLYFPSFVMYTAFYAMGLCSWLKAMTKKVNYNHGPDKQNENQPDISSILVTEPAKENIPESYKQQSNIDSQAHQAD